MSGGTASERIAHVASGWLGARLSRRNLLSRAAVIGSALTVAPLDFILRPGTAYASVCGPGSTCASSWTAMCCTVNNGVNQCPPGTFAGGWWKADAAGLCGGGARYYIDCQAECRCGCSGSNFCAQGCWDCQPHCASGTCDQRRVCWNVFRYGQCNQQVGCSGPVACRMISCVPPWWFEACTTASATDNNTTDHSAPCLPAAWTRIQARYAALGGAGSFLGPEVDGEYAIAGGSGQNCTRGRLYESRTGVFFMRNAILATCLALGGPAFTGLPITDETEAADRVGWYNLFPDGAIYWTRSTGAHWVHGAIYTHWEALGAGRSPVGYPVTNETRTADGVGYYNGFQSGAIYWTSRTGAHEMHGAIYAHWVGLGYERSPVGYPTSDETGPSTGTARYNLFQNGAIYWSPQTGAHEMHGPIWTAYQERGIAIRLGLPTTDVVTESGGIQQSQFTGGTITYYPSTGRTVISFT